MTEGFIASKEMEIKLTNVARASLAELLADYRDFLRTKGQLVWEKDSKEAKYVRGLGRNIANRTSGANERYMSSESHLSHESYETYKPFIESRPPEIVANIIICLIHQTNYLLDRQMEQLEAAFLKEGGLRERMTRARIESRKKVNS
jgi:four helix bundle suffix protein